MLPGPANAGHASHDARLRRLITLVCALVVCDLALWSAIVPLVPYYRRQLGLTTLQVGWMLAAFSVAVVVVAVPIGHLADRWGARRVTAAGAQPALGAADRHLSRVGLR